MWYLALRSKEKEKGLSLSHIHNLEYNNPSYECGDDTKENIQECLRRWALNVVDAQCCNGHKPCNN